MILQQQEVWHKEQDLQRMCSDPNANSGHMYLAATCTSTGRQLTTTCTNSGMYPCRNLHKSGNVLCRKMYVFSNLLSPAQEKKLV